MNQWIYVIIPLFILLALFLYFYIRKAYAIRRVCAMSVSGKLERLNQITAPFGFEYRLFQDIFTSRTDARWQRECGCTGPYDRQAPFFHMIFDCDPVCFDYNGSTWLIEFWKGQYGITTGCEIGVYKSDKIISKEKRKHTLFHAVPDTEMPFLRRSRYSRWIQLKNRILLSLFIRLTKWIDSENFPFSCALRLEAP